MIASLVRVLPKYLLEMLAFVKNFQIHQNAVTHFELSVVNSSSNCMIFIAFWPIAMSHWTGLSQTITYQTEVIGTDFYKKIRKTHHRQE